MLTHYGDFFCSLGGKDLFKTGFSLSEAAFWGVRFCLPEEIMIVIFDKMRYNEPYKYIV